MKTNLLRLSGLSLLLAIVAAASAEPMIIVTRGTYEDDVYGKFLSGTGLSWSSNMNEPMHFITMFGGNMHMGPGPVANTQWVISSGTIYMNLTPQSSTQIGNMITDTGIWKIVPSLGEGYWTNKAGEGIYTTTRILSTTQPNFYTGGTTFVGNVIDQIVPVPEPGSFAALGLGVAVLLRRRIKTNSGS